GGMALMAGAPGRNPGCAEAAGDPTGPGARHRCWSAPMWRGVEMDAETYRFNVGTFECIAVNDGTFTYTAGQYFGNAPREELGQALHDHRLDPERIPSPYTCLVVNTGAHLVLLDTGAGPFAPGVGRLLQRLRAKGIAP